MIGTARGTRFRYHAKQRLAEIKPMLILSEDTETLARRLAEAQKLSVDDTVRRALKQQAQAVGLVTGTTVPRFSESGIARRHEVVREIQREIAALPVLDSRSPEAIMDDLNER